MESVVCYRWGRKGVRKRNDGREGRRVSSYPRLIDHFDLSTPFIAVHKKNPPMSGQNMRNSPKQGLGFLKASFWLKSSLCEPVWLTLKKTKPKKHCFSEMQTASEGRQHTVGCCCPKGSDLCTRCTCLPQTVLILGLKLIQPYTCLSTEKRNIHWCW